MNTVRALLRARAFQGLFAAIAAAGILLLAGCTATGKGDTPAQAEATPAKPDLLSRPVAPPPPPKMAAQKPASSASIGIRRLQDWIQGPPLNINDDQINAGINQAVGFLQERGEDIAGGVFAGVSTLGSVVITLLLVLVA